MKNKYIKLLLLCFLLSPLVASANPLLIGIAGGSGAGKTTFVKAVREEFGDRVSVLYMDNYYRDLGHLPLDERSLVNFDEPVALDLEELSHHLTELRAGRGVNQPVYSFETKRRVGSTWIEPTDVVLVDGFLLLAVPELLDLIDLKLFIDVDELTRLFRIINRDIEERGFTLEETHKRYLAFIRPCHELHVEPSKLHADLVIPGGTDNLGALQHILCLVQAKLSANVNEGGTGSP